MRILVTLACSIALVSAVHAQQENKPHQKKQSQPAQHAAKPTVHPAASATANTNKRMPPSATGGQKPTTGHTSTAAYQPHKGNQKGKSQTSTAAYQGQKGKSAQNSNAAYQAQKAKKNQTQAERQTAKAANERQTAKATNAGQVKGRGKPNQA